MKLSEMSTNEVGDVLVTVLPEIELLMNDEKLIEMWTDRTRSSDKKEAARFGTLTFIKLASYLMKNQRDSTWRILGAVNQKTPEEIGNQFFTTTLNQTMDVLQDKELMSFFTSPGKSERTNASDI